MRRSLKAPAAPTEAASTRTAPPSSDRRTSPWQVRPRASDDRGAPRRRRRPRRRRPRRSAHVDPGGEADDHDAGQRRGDDHRVDRACGPARTSRRRLRSSQRANSSSVSPVPIPNSDGDDLVPGRGGRDRDPDVAGDQQQQDPPDQVVDVGAAEVDVARATSSPSADHVGARADEAEA